MPVGTHDKQVDAVGFDSLRDHRLGLTAGDVCFHGETPGFEQEACFVEPSAGFRGVGQKLGDGNLGGLIEDLFDTGMRCFVLLVSKQVGLVF